MHSRKKPIPILTFLTFLFLSNVNAQEETCTQTLKCSTFGDENGGTVCGSECLENTLISPYVFDNLDTINYKFTRQNPTGCDVTSFVLDIPPCVNPASISAIGCNAVVTIGSSGGCDGFNSPMRITINSQSCPGVTVTMPGATASNSLPIGITSNQTCSSCLSKAFQCGPTTLCDTPCDDCNKCTNDMCAFEESQLDKRSEEGEGTPLRADRCSCIFEEADIFGCPGYSGGTTQYSGNNNGTESCGEGCLEGIQISAQANENWLTYNFTGGSCNLSHFLINIPT